LTAKDAKGFARGGCREGVFDTAHEDFRGGRDARPPSRSRRGAEDAEKGVRCQIFRFAQDDGLADGGAFGYTRQGGPRCIMVRGCGG
jgi:hypothetical protein